MARECFEQRTIGRIPELDGLVVTARSKNAAVRSVRGGISRSLMTGADPDSIGCGLRVEKAGTGQKRQGRREGRYTQLHNSSHIQSVRKAVEVPSGAVSSKPASPG